MLLLKMSVRQKVLRVVLCYLFEMTLKSSSEKMLATKMSYVGKVFMPYVLAMFAYQYCGKKVPKIVKICLFSFHTVILVLVLTSEMHNLYYTFVSFTKEGLFPHNVYGHGGDIDCIIFYCFCIQFI